jgi:hypothetical protein
MLLDAKLGSSNQTQIEAVKLGLGEHGHKCALGTPHPPETAAPMKANELSFPEVSVDAWDPVSEVESVGEVAELEVSIKEEVTPATRPIQSSSSS